MKNKLEQEFREQVLAMNASLVVAIVLLACKVVAAIVTGSSSIYSDAAESVVHLLAVIFAVWSLKFAYKPADDSHHFGHDKVSFVSAGFEGAMILAASLLILYEAIQQCFHGVKIQNIGIGVTLTAAAAVINLLLAWWLIRVGNKRNSLVLRANGRHVLTDVWSSVAVLVALLLVKWTKWPWWDPIAAILAALNIARMGVALIRESLTGLLDEADLELEGKIRDLLASETSAREMGFHHLRHRYSGHSHWVEFHLVCADELSVGKAHEHATEIEAKVASLLQPHGRVMSHIEPISLEHHDETWELPRFS